MVLAALVLAGCSGAPYSLTLMPAPTIYAFEKHVAIEEPDAPESHPGLLYATWRPPSADGAEPYYVDDRGDVVRLGRASISVRESELSRTQIAVLAASPDRERDITLTLNGVDEFGILEPSLTPFSNPALSGPDVPRGDGAFADAIEDLFEHTGEREIFIYVHGYRVPFSNPLLVAAEFWHFLDYRGALIAFSWPSTFNRWAYLTDLESAALSAHSFRKFLSFLSTETSAERIHIIGYSAGTRVVLDSLHQIALSDRKTDGAERLPIGRVILTGSDIDRGLFAMRLEDGLLDSVDSLTLYLSKDDAALGLLRMLGFRPRAGEPLDDDALTPNVVRYIEERPNLILINVAEAEGSTVGNGHGYFRSSPWVSSDIIAASIYGLAPADRGLARSAGDPIWRFPENYPERLRQVVGKQKPIK